MTDQRSEPEPGGGRVCRARHASVLSTPLRRLFHKPERILHGLISSGQTVVDLGCGPGFFTLEMARLVGEDGCVIAVDLQKEMLDRLMAQAERQGLTSRIRPHQCSANSIELTDPVDFALAFYMVHELPDVKKFFYEVAGIVKPDGWFLLVEPKFHVSRANFAKTVEIARAAGFKPASEPRVTLSRSVLFQRKLIIEEPVPERNREAA